MKKKDNLRFTMIITLIIIGSALLSPLITMAIYPSEMKRTRVSIEISDDILITKTYFKGELIHRDFDVIKSDDDIHLPLLRYGQGLQYIERFEKVDSINQLIKRDEKERSRKNR